MNKLALDTNIVLYLLNKDARSQDIFKVISKYDKCYISSLTFGTIWYFVEKWKLDFDFCKSLLLTIEILPTTKSDCYQGLRLSNNEDVEDGIQVAVCKNNKIVDFLTADILLEAKYKGELNIILV
jgi:predicted nucleic acid-binding protein